MGGYAEQSMLATQMAQEMQAQSLEYIKAQYYREDTSFDITNMSLTELVGMVEEAVKNGTLEQLNAQFAAQLLPIIMQQGQ